MGCTLGLVLNIPAKVWNEAAFNDEPARSLLLSHKLCAYIFYLKTLWPTDTTSAMIATPMIAQKYSMLATKVAC